MKIFLLSPTSVSLFLTGQPKNISVKISRHTGQPNVDCSWQYFCAHPAWYVFLSIHMWLYFLFSFGSSWWKHINFTGCWLSFEHQFVPSHPPKHNGQMRFSFFSSYTASFPSVGNVFETFAGTTTPSEASSVHVSHASVVTASSWVRFLFDIFNRVCVIMRVCVLSVCVLIAGCCVWVRVSWLGGGVACVRVVACVVACVCVCVKCVACVCVCVV